MEDFDIKKILNTNDKSKVKTESDITIVDKDWIASRYMVANDSLPDDLKDIRYASTAAYKFTDSSLGGNIIINPRPQFTRYCDVRNNGLRNVKKQVTKSADVNLGMGRYYSEAIDDNQQAVFMEFGLPKFNSLADFFLRAVDYSDSVLANTGRPSTAYTAGKLIGGLAMLAAFPIITLAVWTVKVATKLFLGSGMYEYYYMVPHMHLYWGTVNQIVSQLATELGILNPIFMPENSNTTKDGKIKIGTPLKISQNDIDELKEFLPDGIIGDGNYIDVFAIATKAQKLANEQKRIEYELIERDQNISLLNARKATNTIADKINHYTTFSNYLTDVTPILNRLEKGDYKPNETEKISDGESQKESVDKEYKKNKTAEGQYEETVSTREKSFAENMVAAIDSTVRQGGAFAVFGVDYTGSVSESFSNSTDDISTGENIKQLSRRTRDLKFDTAGGNIVGTMGDSVAALKGVLAGALDSITFGLSSVVETITGGGYIDLPKKWSDSDASLPSITYNMQLISPYGNTISQLQNMYIPLCMLLAGVLPLSTGKSSYTSPYLCSVYAKGLQNIKLGMITEVSITRGTSNLGFDKNRRPLAIDVSFKVTDFSKLIAAPVNSSIFDGVFNFTVDDDTPLGNYLAILGGRDIMTNKYAVHQMKLKASRAIMKFEQAISPHAWGLRTGELLSDVLGPLVAQTTLTGNYVNQ
jgi:hypothetical protein